MIDLLDCGYCVNVRSSTPFMYLCCSTFSAKTELGAICCQRMEGRPCCESQPLGTKDDGVDKAMSFGEQM